MAATALAAVPAFTMIGFGKHHKTIFEVIIFV